MQEIKKSRILLASVLKPVDDTRMFEKFGVSLAKNYEVHIAGYPVNRLPLQPTIHFHPHQRFNRISIHRLLVPFKVFRTLVRIKPRLFIFTTHELIFVAIVARLLFRCKIVYDVQENYFRNILYTQTFPPVIRIAVAGFVRLKEWIFSGFIHHFVFAEHGYKDEIRFIAHNKITVVENKIIRQNHINRKEPATPGNRVQFIFSGTLAVSTGVFVAIDIIKKFHHIDNRVRLIIIGHCAHAQTLECIQTHITGIPFISLRGGRQLVPHAEIMEALLQADVGLVTYPNNPSTALAMPTKLYEYLGVNLPILLIEHANWKKRCAPFQAAVTFDANHVNTTELWKQLQNFQFYTSQPDDIYWEDEETKLLLQIRSLLPSPESPIYT